MNPFVSPFVSPIVSLFVNPIVSLFAHMFVKRFANPIANPIFIRHILYDLDSISLFDIVFHHHRYIGSKCDGNPCRCLLRKKQNT